MLRDLETPWGKAEHVERIADGIDSISTASHGGLRLSEAAQRSLPADVLATFINGPAWAEEDCETPIVLTLLEMMPGPVGRRAALRMARHLDRYAAAVPHLEEVVKDG